MTNPTDKPAYLTSEELNALAPEVEEWRRCRDVWNAAAPGCDAEKSLTLKIVLYEMARRMSELEKMLMRCDQCNSVITDFEGATGIHSFYCEECA